jgi:hypothetical protein
MDAVREAGVGAVAPVIVAAFRDRPDETTQAIGRYAASIGIEPGLAAGHFAVAVDVMSKQAEALASKMGITNMDRFNSWARANYADTAASVAVRHLVGGETRAWMPLMTQYLHTFGRDA